MRRLTTLRERIVQEMIRCQIRLTSILDEYLPEYEKCFCKITIKTSLALLKKYGIKGLTDRANREEVVKDIVHFSRHRIKDMHARWIADRLTESIGIKEGLTGAEFELPHIKIYRIPNLSDSPNIPQFSLLNALKRWKKPMPKIALKKQEKYTQILAFFSNTVKYSQGIKNTYLGINHKIH